MKTEQTSTGDNKLLKNLRRIAPTIVVVVLFAIIALAYFTPAVFEGRELFQQDVAGASGTAQDVRDYKEATGETSYWTNSLFGGMPMYQIAPSYPSTKSIQWIQDFLTLRTPLNILGSYSWMLFAMMIGFFLLMRSLRVRRLPAVIGSVMWAFSSYFLILIVAGHIWKLTALCFIPPTIAGLIWTYRGDYLRGGICTAFFTALQIMANHIQMSYYFFFVMLFLVIGFLVEAFRNKTLKRFGTATAVTIVAGLIGVAINLSSLYHTYEYSQETMRGGSELTLKQENADTDRISHENSKGLDKEYITQWSYGKGETWTLLIPNAKGGATGYLGQNEKAMAKVQQVYSPTVAQMNSYWGNQPFTAGPVYVGAFVVFLFILGCFIVKGPVKWAMLAATLFSITLSWGHNMMWLTDFFIDHIPLYNKFRTVSSILVIAELCIPVLAVLALVQFIKEPKVVMKNTRATGTALFATAGMLLLFLAVPTIFFDFFSKQEMQFFAQASGQADVSGVMGALKSVRLGIFRADVVRSLFIVLFGTVILFLYAKGFLKRLPALIIIALLVLSDLWLVNKRYLNDSHFIDNALVAAKAHPVTDADRLIKSNDASKHYRVLNLSVNTFNDATTSYMHRSIGGYHPAKLQRYQDLIEHQLMKNNQRVFDMLDTRYFIVPDKQQLQVSPNPYAYGAAWLTEDVRWVDNANEEITALDSTDLKRVAVIDKRWQTPELTSLKPVPTDSTEFVELVNYTPNRAGYRIRTSVPRVVVFSEIFYPHGWKATLNGRPADIFRANYVLRAMWVPAGSHEVEMQFAPRSVKYTEGIAVAAIAVLLLFIGFAVFRETIGKKKSLKQ